MLYLVYSYLIIMIILYDWGKNMGVLDGIVGTIDSGSEYDLQAYQNYLANLMSKVINSQYNIEVMAKEITSTVMVEGKWYDDCAAAFARWWNDDAGEKDGIDYLNGLSTILENLVKITATEVCVDMRNSTTMRASYSAYSLINDFANGSPYIHGIRNMTKADLGQIRETVCRAGVKNSANGEQINSMIGRVSECADTIKSNVKEICNSIQEDLIDGRALKIKGLDSSILEDRKRDMLFRVNTIVERLSNELKNSRLKISRDEAVVKSTLDGSDASSAINAAAAATVAGTVSAATMTAEDMAADANHKARAESSTSGTTVQANRFSRPIDATNLSGKTETTNLKSQTTNSSSKGTLDGVEQKASTSGVKNNSSTGKITGGTQTFSSSISGSTGTRNTFTTGSGTRNTTTGGRIPKPFDTTNLTQEQVTSIRNSSGSVRTINGGNTGSKNTLNSVEQKANSNYLKGEVQKTSTKSSSSQKTNTSSSSKSSASNKGTNSSSSSAKSTNNKASNYAKGSANAAKATGQSSSSSNRGFIGDQANKSTQPKTQTKKTTSSGGGRPNTTTGSKMVNQSASTRKIPNAKPPASSKSSGTFSTVSSADKTKPKTKGGLL